MTSNEPAPEPRATTWRELAVARSLDPARVRAENRVQRFVDAAMALMNDGNGKDFTVQEVVERSGQSLRSFYQYFGGKHELLLALFEELVRTSADHLREFVSDVDDPRDRLHRFIVEYHRMCRPTRKGRAGRKPPAPAVMVDFGQRLLTAHPAEAARAHAPMVSLFRELLDDAAAAGAIRPDVRRERVAGIVLEAIMFNAFSMTIAASSDDGSDVDPGEELWDLVFRGIGAE
jgi:AcrR family transcriptional regulator